ncbi:hypothetical protein ABZ769_28260 [Streptomyces olivoreticuli]
MADTYDFPPDLRAAQLELHQAYADLEALGRALPWSAEPMQGWTTKSGRVDDDRVVVRPDSPGYTGEQKAELQRLRERLLELAAAVSTHSFWGTVDSGRVVDARMALKHVHEQPDG